MMIIPARGRFPSILRLQWKTSRLMTMVAAFLAFTLPVYSVRAIQGADVRTILRQMSGWSTAYTLLSATLGLIVALGVWSADQRGRHVYALALPMDRWRYVVLKYLGGLVCLVAPMVTLLAGCLVAVAMIDLPLGLHVYPIALTVRFALAVFVSFSLFFAVAGATPRTAAAIFGVIAVALIGQYLLTLANQDLNLFERIAQAVFSTKGIFGVFTARWMLIDV